MIALLIAGALSSAAAPAQAPVVVAPITAVKPPVPRQPLERLFSPMDYPAAAEGTGAQGRVEVALLVAADGRVSGCTITASSGTSVLDATTCRILRSRARFDPARDKDGRAAIGTYAFAKEWKAPGRESK